MQDADCHVLVSSRDKDAIFGFLDAFLPDERNRPDAGWLVNVDGEEREINDVDELIEFCIKHPTEAHSVYWNGENQNSRRTAWVFFTVDDAMICGLSCDTEDEKQEEALLEKLKKHFGTDIGYITYYFPPPNSASEYTTVYESFGISSK